MTAGEAQKPRYNMPRAFRTVFYRLTLFFMLGSLCVGLVVPYNDPDLLHAISNPHAGAGASPYVISMRHMHIPVLPHIVNAMVMTSIFSAGNSFVYCASRTLYGLALERKAPRIFITCTKSGIPIYSVGITVAIASLGDFNFMEFRKRGNNIFKAFLQVTNSAANVLQWIFSSVTVCHLINVAITSSSYTRFYNVSVESCWCALSLHESHESGNEKTEHIA